MRRLFRNIHLWLSLPLGLVISVICLSGAALVFERDITRALQRELYTVTPPSEGAHPLSPSILEAGIMTWAADSLHLTSIKISDNPHEAAFASFRETGRRQLSVDPYTGEVKGWTKSYPFFQTVKKIHRWLLDPPPSKGQKSVGKVIVGVTTLVMVVILISGLIIWIPRNRKALKSRLSISVTKGWRRFWYDSHVTLGFYCTIFLLIMALTGLTWSFGWYRDAAYSLFGNDTPEQARTLRGLFYALHTGSWGGIVTKVLYFIAALLGGILPLSGYWLWWKRTKKNRHQRKDQSQKTSIV